MIVFSVLIMIYIKHFLVSTLKPIEEAPSPPLDDITEDPEDPNPGPTCYSIKTEVVSLSLYLSCVKSLQGH